MMVRREIAQSRCVTGMREPRGPEEVQTALHVGRSPFNESWRTEELFSDSQLRDLSRKRAASLPAEGLSQQRIRDCSRSVHG